MDFYWQAGSKRMHRPDSLHKLRNAGLLLCLSFCSGHLFAAISTDGTVGAARSLAGPNYAIPASLGSQVGGNLFHSFSVFNINTGESATFSGPNNVSNIIARVTGGGLSTIDGGLNSTIPLANLILINPSGIVFGPNAALDVGGSFYASTANDVRLTDGGKFDATTPANSVLTTAPLAAFGFLGPVAPISVQGANLAVAEGKTLSLIGGDIDVTGSLKALGGSVNIASVASAGVVGLAPRLDVSGFASLGAISLDAPIDVSAGVISGTGTTEQAGSIYIQGGQITTGAAANLTAYTSNLAGGNIDIRATDTMTMNQSLVSTDAKGAGHGGSINLHAASMVLNSTAIYADALGSGHGGNVSLDAGSMILDNTQVYADTYGAGNAGNVTITADQLDVLNGTWISSDALTSSTGNGGSVNVTVTGSMTVANGLITTKAKGIGQGGSIILNAGSMILDGAKVYADTWGAGNAGNVTITANQLDVLNGTWISSDALANSTGSGGLVDVSVSGNMTVANGAITTLAEDIGFGGNINIYAGGSIFLGGGAQIQSDSTWDGDAGSISIAASELNVDGGTISSTASDWGKGGNINITVDKLILANLGTIDVTTSSPYANGTGGNVNIEATTSIDLSGGAQIKSDSTGKGNAGSINIKKTSKLNIDGGIISSRASSWGDGGWINIDVDKLILANGGKIDGTTSGTNPDGWGGTIKINAINSVALSGGAQISSETSGDASADIIKIRTAELSIDGGTISSKASGWGNGGLIDIGVDKLILANGGMIDTTTSSIYVDQWGGDIKINATNSVELNSGSKIKSDSIVNALAGWIFIETPELKIDGGTISSAAGTYDAPACDSRVCGWGTGGGIEIGVDKLAISNRGSIDVGAFEYGNGGHVKITAGSSINLSSGAFIISDTWWQGMGGTISLSAPVINIDGGYVDATVYGQGAGGAIVVNADKLTLFNGASIDASSFGDGAGGDIRLSATSSVSLSGGAQIASKSSGNGVAGHISINSGSTFTLDNGSVTTEALVSDGGNISLVATDLIYLNSGNITATVNSGMGNGGNIFIDPQFVVLNSSNITANAFGGNGGNINLIANNFLQSANSTISASSALGVPGTVALNAELTDLSGSLANLPMVYLDATGLIKQRCAAQLEGKISTFVTSGRGGIPHEPGNLMPSASLLVVTGLQAGAGGMNYASLSGAGCAN